MVKSRKQLMREYKKICKDHGYSISEMDAKTIRALALFLSEMKEYRPKQYCHIGTDPGQRHADYAIANGIGEW